MRLLLTSIVIIFLFGSCNVFKSLRYGGIPSQNDFVHFPQRKVANNEEAIFNFRQPHKDYGLGTTIGLTDRDFNSTNVSLDEFAKLHKTEALLIIRNDTILYEKYLRDKTDTTLFSSFSMVKPMISTLIGIAIDEGEITSEDELLISYLTEYNQKTGWEKITIENLLHHNSGIKFTDSQFSPASDNAEYYWGNNLREKALAATIECAPNTVFKYSSINTLLLGLILERVYSKSLSSILEEKIWKRIGAESAAYWSLDAADSTGVEKAFCCLQTRAVDIAKFGKLYLQNGNWNGEQIVSKAWVKSSTTPDPNGNNKHYYNNNWGIGPIKYGSFFAVGLFSQYLYIYPEKNIIIVRYGDTETSAHPNYWQTTFLQIIDQLEKF